MERVERAERTSLRKPPECGMEGLGVVTRDLLGFSGS